MDKEILAEFRSETNSLMRELVVIVERLEDHESDEFPTDVLENYALRVDRIMGTAKTISAVEPDNQGLVRIGKITELCKKTGYKAAQLGITELIPIFAGFWADTIEVLQDLMDSLEDEAKTQKIAEDFSGVLEGRLEWLAKKVSELAGDEKEVAFDLEAMLKTAGL